MLSNLSEQLLGRFKVVERVVEESRWPAVRLTDCRLELGKPSYLESGAGAGYLKRRCQNKERKETGPRGSGSTSWCTVCCKRFTCASESRKFEETPETLRKFVEGMLNSENMTKDGNRLPGVNLQKIELLTFCTNCYSAIKYFVATLEKAKELEVRIQEMKTKFRVIVETTVSISQKENKHPVGLAEEGNCLRQAIVGTKLCSKQKNGLFTSEPNLEMPSEDIHDFSDDDSIPVLSPAMSILDTFPDSTATDQLTTTIKDEADEGGHTVANFDEGNLSNCEANNSTKEICPAAEDNQIKTKRRSTLTKKSTAAQKRIGNAKGTINPRSFNNLPPEKLSQTQAAISWRELRAKYPDKSQKEIKAIRKLESAKKRQNGKYYTKGLVHPKSFLNRPSEQLSQTYAARAYRKLRLEFPDKSMREIKQLVKQRAAENQKKQLSAERVKIKTTEDGRIFYKNVEILKLENGLYACSKCEYRKKTGAIKITSVKNHINMAHAPRSYECSECKKSFYHDSLLQEHIRLCQRKEKLVCPQCGSSFNHQPSFLTHIRVVHKGIKPHTCEHCGKSFATLKDMNIHIRRHTGERPFVCHVCGDTFIEKQSMKKHIRSKHPGAIEDVNKMDTRTCPESASNIIDQKSYTSSNNDDFPFPSTTEATNIINEPEASSLMDNNKTGTG